MAEELSELANEPQLTELEAKEKAVHNSLEELLVVRIKEFQRVFSEGSLSYKMERLKEFERYLDGLNGGENSQFSSEIYRRMFAVLTSHYHIDPTEISTGINCGKDTLLEFVSGEGYLTREQKQKMRELYMKKSNENGPMSLQDMLHAIKDLYDLSTGEMAKQIGYSRETIRRWLKGDEVKKQPQKDAIQSAYTRLILGSTHEDL